MKEYKPDYAPEENYESSIPGLGPEMLEPGINVREATGGSGGGAKMIRFTRASSVGTGNQSFTGFGFTPTHYSIVAWRNGTGGECMSHGGVDANGSEGCVYIAPASSGGPSEQAISTRSLRVFYTNSGGGDTRASHVSFDSDGVTLNFDRSGENIQFELTCYS